MNILIVGAGRGLGRALLEGIAQPGDSLIGVSRRRPDALAMAPGIDLQWIEADLAMPAEAVAQIEAQTPAELDVLICNVGIWEEHAFSEQYSFLGDSDASIGTLVDVNITATLLLLKRLVPRLLGSARPQLILTGSTSALRQSGRPEVAFGATKFALNGMADALRESFRDQRLAVTVLQLGNLNTDDPLATPLTEAATRGEGQLIPVHDVLTLVDALLRLSTSSFVRELTLPAMGDERF
ncbi:SDR family oxidoreductase [Pseudomonas nicosulfuronedens]|uniref:SDR family oxidoreductase n=1 Tax=Pseudomonas nicosulfuronedens TaxID=2571105 RepID=A0A5R9QUK9_9PSED|nr:SDR family oxidoreductase [Pseudomonas nicosulfuronedens]MDH1010077.1 SDR family oxidoreductase [Pseudomonas nicosulfuronedens]MDH1980093.1 SDR family oxidoreductase [Pseudomonas nicosulfuronedens]MDH2025312.1 SDR family oxidoreductase [Pseudomonas nicosulfuronedens]TLX73597.1 SDR family oxidoreductase [Pseudomonas nicosulfuronedens]